MTGELGAQSLDRLSRLQKDILLGMASLSLFSPPAPRYGSRLFRSAELGAGRIPAVPRFLLSLVPANRAQLEKSRMETIQATTSKSLRTLAKKGCVVLLDKNLEPFSGDLHAKVKYVALSRRGAFLAARMIAGAGLGDRLLDYCRGLLLFRGPGWGSAGGASTTVARWMTDDIETITGSSRLAGAAPRSLGQGVEDPLFSFLASYLPR